jgi:hypothetical protein
MLLNAIKAKMALVKPLQTEQEDDKDDDPVGRAFWIVAMRLPRRVSSFGLEVEDAVEDDEETAVSFTAVLL